MAAFMFRVTVNWPVPKLSACTPVPPGAHRGRVPDRPFCRRPDPAAGWQLRACHHCQRLCRRSGQERAKLESKDIVSPLWESLTTRPSLPNTPCELLTVEQTGATAAQRIAMVRDELKKAGATALAVTGLDCVGWLTNMRARDLPCTPLAVAYALVTMTAAPCLSPPAA